MSFDPTKHPRGFHGHFSVEGAIVKAHADLKQPSSQFVGIQAIRAHPAVKEHSPEDVTAALKKMGRGGFAGATLIPKSNQQALSADEHRHAIIMGGDPVHVLVMDHSDPNIKRIAGEGGSGAHEAPAVKAAPTAAERFRGSASVPTKAPTAAPTRSARDLMSTKPATIRGTAAVPKAAPVKPTGQAYTRSDLVLKTNDAMRDILRARGTAIPKGAQREKLISLIVGGS